MHVVAFVEIPDKILEIPLKLNDMGSLLQDGRILVVDIHGSGQHHSVGQMDEVE